MFASALTVPNSPATPCLALSSPSPGFVDLPPALPPWRCPPPTTTTSTARRAEADAVRRFGFGGSVGGGPRGRRKPSRLRSFLPSPADVGLLDDPSVFAAALGSLAHVAADHAHNAAESVAIHAQSAADRSFLLASDSVAAHSTTATAAATREGLGDLAREVAREIGREVSEYSTSGEAVGVTPAMEKASLDDIGHDLLIFLAACVGVSPLSSALNVSPVLLYLLFGLIAGPHGLSLLRGAEEVGFELGDFGILFLLFVEGLNLSPERLRELGSFFSLGATQLLLSVSVIFFGLFLGGPLLLQVVSDPSVPIDPLIVQLVEQPVAAFAIAAAGALSSSAFVLPILKEKGWVDRPDGIAALSILLLQDLAVAPLLVILPLIANVEGTAIGGGGGGADPIQLGILAFKATVGFGAVLALASVALRRVFQLVASSKSSQSFVAASLLVAVGMGVISDFLGLSSTTGAFAAGVLLAESGYRAQIEADIKPFEGILLGVFFITAGSALDPDIVLEYWPTLAAGISSFLLIKFAIIFSGGGALGLTKGDAARVGILLAGGGEFAFVVFNLASENGILPDTLGKLLTASVIISMALTPALGEVAEFVGEKLDANEASVVKSQWFGDVDSETVEEGIDFDYDVSVADEGRIKEAFERFDENGNGEISVEELQDIFTVAGERDADGKLLTLDQVRRVIDRFDDNGDGVLQFQEFAQLWMAKRQSAMSEDALRRAVVVCGYNEVGQQLCTMLDKSNIAGIPYVAFARDAETISAGIKRGARVIYGNGASASLIRAAGVEEPAAIAVTYRQMDQCLDATKCLRDAFPDTPIFARSERKDAVKSLIQAGATEVVVATGGVATGMGQLLGVQQSRGYDLMEKYPEAKTLVDVTFPLLSGIDVNSDDHDLDPNEIRKIYRMFSTSLTLNDDGKVQLSELVGEILRMSDGVEDDNMLVELLDCSSLDDQCEQYAQNTYLSFSEFVALYRRNQYSEKVRK